MSRVLRAGAMVAMLAMTAGAGIATADPAAAAGEKGPFSQRVRNACKSDYNRFCPNYNLYSHELRRCMQAAGKAISQGCIRALVDAGEVPRSMLSK